MAGKVFLRALPLMLVLLTNLAFAGGGGIDDLFSKIRINPIKGAKKAPNFSLKDMTGKKVEIKQFKGKVVFLNFWATWCGPCKEEMPGLEVLHQKLQGEKFVLLTVSVDYEGLKLVQGFISKHRYTFRVLLDPNGETLDLFEIKGIPTTFVIDKSGKVIGRAIGPRDWKSPEVFSLINLLVEN